MTNTTTATAHADQLHAEVRDARDCDAINPCANCRAKTTVVRAARHAERVAAGRINAAPTEAPTVPAPRVPTMLSQRLAAAR